jgi:outer membrane protein assembly factor BamB
MEPYRDNSKQEKRFYIGTKGHVLCIDQQTGNIVWDKLLVNRKISEASLVSLLLYKGLIYAVCKKIVACLECADGRVVWNTDIGRLGEPAALALDLEVPGGQLIIAAQGELFSVSAESGAILWENSLPGLRYEPICLRVPGAIVAQPVVRFVSSVESVLTQVIENEQLER